MGHQNSQHYRALSPRKLSNGFTAVQIHYSVHPLRQDPNWIKQASQGMKQQDVEREWECKLTSGEGLLFPYDCLYDDESQPILRSVYTKPIPGERYVIGADASEGGGNPCCAVVLDMAWNEVNHYHGRQEPRAFAKTLFNLGNLYNKALLGVEDEKYGAIVLTKLQDMHYPNLFYTKQKPRIKRGRREKPKKKLGWQTNGPSKLKLVSDLLDAMIQGTLGIATAQTLAEMNTFIEKGSTLAAAPGNFDDRVLATGIALQLLLQMPASLERLDKQVGIGDELETVDPYGSDLDIGSISIPSEREHAEEVLISTKMDW